MNPIFSNFKRMGQDCSISHSFEVTSVWINCHPFERMLLLFDQLILWFFQIDWISCRNHLGYVRDRFYVNMLKFQLKSISLTGSIFNFYDSARFDTTEQKIQSISIKSVFNYEFAWYFPWNRALDALIPLENSSDR